MMPIDNLHDVLSELIDHSLIQVDDDLISVSQNFINMYIESKVNDHQELAIAIQDYYFRILHQAKGLPLKDHVSNIWACIERMKVQKEDEMEFELEERLSETDKRINKSCNDERNSSKFFEQGRVMRSETHVIKSL